MQFSSTRKRHKIQEFVNLGTVYTDAVSFVTASVSMRLRLSFTRRRSSLLSEPCRFEYAFKSGAKDDSGFGLGELSLRTRVWSNLAPIDEAQRPENEIALT